MKNGRYASQNVFDQRYEELVGHQPNYRSNLNENADKYFLKEGRKQTGKVGLVPQ